MEDRIDSQQLKLYVQHGHIPPRQLKVLEGAAHFGLIGKWAYYGHVEALLGRFNATGKTAWDVLHKEMAHLCWKKTGVARRILETTPGCFNPATQQIMKFGGYVTKEKMQERLTEVRFSFGAHGFKVIQHPIPGIRKEYMIVEVTDQAAAMAYCAQSSRWNGATRVSATGKRRIDPVCNVSLYADPTPLVGRFTQEDFDAAMKMPAIRGASLTEEQLAADRLEDEFNHLKGVIGPDWHTYQDMIDMENQLKALRARV